MNRYILTLQRRVGSAFAFIPMSDLALAAFELMPQARRVRVIEETSSMVRIRYAWPLGRTPILLTDEEFDRYGLVCLRKAGTGKWLVSNTPQHQSEQVSRVSRATAAQTNEANSKRQHYVDAEQIRAHWATNVRFLPNFELFDNRELKLAVAMGIEALLRNQQPTLIQHDLKVSYERLVGEANPEWKHVLQVAEHVYGHVAAPLAPAV